MAGDLEKRMDQFVESLQCRAPGPYPSTKVSRQNPADAEKLLDAYGGQAGELTAVTQYFDHSLRFGQEPAGDLELAIAMVEMKHLDLLGDLIKGLGGDPKYYCAKHNWWTGENVFYSPQKVDLLQNDITIEKKAIADYEKLLREVQEPEVRAVIERIVADEKEHVRLFEEALARLRSGQ